ncbi:hypothetical protein ATANTOWER_000531 [Ataeniobius toweri]|uniref:Uncharacterized protein n=1 Tax=Ataeniobius toweri TaxID=208326 RepID=A0ABU7C823_9TELE|nr:hypothetical protein [Ataeniobius toweri]
MTVNPANVTTSFSIRFPWVPVLSLKMHFVFGPSELFVYCWIIYHHMESFPEKQQREELFISVLHDSGAADREKPATECYGTALVQVSRNPCPFADTNPHRTNLSLSFQFQFLKHDFLTAACTLEDQMYDGSFCVRFVLFCKTRLQLVFLL